MTSSDESTATNPTVAQPTTATSRQLSWDILRVLAIVSVVVEHATYNATIPDPDIGAQPFDWNFLIGANTMLLISAYFVCVTLSKRPPMMWWWNRVTRLIPPYLVAVIAAAVVLNAVAPAGWQLPTRHDIIGNLLMLESFANPANPNAVHYVDPSYWTLPAQLAAFTVAALLVRWSNWKNPRKLPAFCWALIAAPLAFNLVPSHWTDVGIFFNGIAIYRWQLFGMGIALWLWSQRRISLEHSVLLLSLGLFVECYEDRGLPTGWKSALALGVIIAVMAITVARPQWAAPLHPVLGRPVAWLASISYSVYLVNHAIGYCTQKVLAQAGVSAWPKLAGTLVVVGLLGWLLTRYIERPIHRMLLTGSLNATQKARTWSGWLWVRLWTCSMFALHHNRPSPETGKVSEQSRNSDEHCLVTPGV